MAAGRGWGGAAWQHPPGPPASRALWLRYLWRSGGAAHRPPPAPLLELPCSPQRAPSQSRPMQLGQSPARTCGYLIGRWLPPIPLGRPVSGGGPPFVPPLVTPHGPGQRSLPAGASLFAAGGWGRTRAAPWSVRVRGQQRTSGYGCDRSRPWASRAMAGRTWGPTVPCCCW